MLDAVNTIAAAAASALLANIDDIHIAAVKTTAAGNNTAALNTITAAVTTIGRLEGSHQPILPRLDAATSTATAAAAAAAILLATVSISPLAAIRTRRPGRLARGSHNLRTRSPLLPL
jgi:hypothetical protein